MEKDNSDNNAVNLPEVFLAKLKRLPEGCSTVLFEKSKYTFSKMVFNYGKSCKVFADELKGKDYISFNLYHTRRGPQLKPCEMPADKVIAFIINLSPLK